MRIVRRSTIYTTVLLAAVVGGGVALIAGHVGTWWALLGIPAALIILWGGFRRSLRRWYTAHRPMPADWRSWLETHVPLYGRFDEEARDHFDRDVRFVLDEYDFEGVGGVEVTPALRLSVAAGVALMLHGRPAWELPGSRTVLFYPERFNDAYYDSAAGEYDGMAHQQGPIILTARAVEDSWTNSFGADNVVLHELAHLFDFDNEGPDGVPSFVASGSAADWQSLVRKEMQHVRSGRSILRPYAAEAPSEFFAVAVETFFEQPRRMARHHAALFESLVAFFHLDPRTGRRTPRPDPALTETPSSDERSQSTGPEEGDISR